MGELRLFLFHLVFGATPDGRRAIFLGFDFSGVIHVCKTSKFEWKCPYYSLLCVPLRDIDRPQENLVENRSCRLGIFVPLLFC